MPFRAWAGSSIKGDILAFSGWTVCTPVMPLLYLCLDINDCFPALIELGSRCPFSKHFHIPIGLFGKHIEKITKFYMGEIFMHDKEFRLIDHCAAKFMQSKIQFRILRSRQSLRNLIHYVVIYLLHSFQPVSGFEDFSPMSFHRHIPVHHRKLCRGQ